MFERRRLNGGVLTLAMLLLGRTALAGDQSELKKQLTADLVGKTFNLRIKAASNTCIFSGNKGFPETSLVDTEMGESLYPTYYLRADRFVHLSHCSRPMARIDNVLSGTHIPANQISVMQQPETPVTVQSVDVKSDRIEFRCQVNGVSGDDGYVKLKLMLDKGSADQNPKQVEILLNRALLLPNIDREQRALALSAQTDQEIDAAEKQLGIADPEQAVTYTRRLIQLYTQKREEQTVIAPSLVTATDQHLALLNSQLAGSQKNAEDNQIGRLRRDYRAALESVHVACSAVDSSKVNSAEDLGSAQAAADVASRSLNELSLRAVSTIDPASVSEAQLLHGSCYVAVSSLRARIASRQKELLAAQQRQADEVQQEQRRQELVELNDAYAILREQQKQLDQRLVAEFGSSPDSDTDAAYRKLLQEMYRNRQTASQLGDAAAAATMQDLDRQYRKLF